MATFTPTPNPEQPGVAYDSTGQHFGLPWLNSEGSNYAALHSNVDTDLIKKAVENKIFDATNQQYKAFYAFYFGRPMLEKPSDEFYYHERNFGRNSMTVQLWTHGSDTINLLGTYAERNDIPVSVGDVIVIPTNNRPVIVTSVTWSAVADSSTIVVTSQSGGSLGASDVTVGDVLSLQSAIGADGTDNVLHYDRLDTTERYNYIQKFNRAYRFGTIELQKWLNNGTTDYLTANKENTLEQIRTDLFSTFINGTRGEYSLPAQTGGGGSYFAKSMGGLYPTMVAAGSASSSVTTSGLQAAFKSLAFQTNTLAKGATRYVLGTDEMLDNLSDSFKNPVQFAPNDRMSSLGLTQYEIGTMKVVPIVCPMFGDSSIFPTFFNRLLMCVDMNAINPVKMKGIDPIRMYQTKSHQDGTNLQAYSDFVVEAMLGLQFSNPLSSFLLNVL